MFTFIKLIIFAMKMIVRKFGAGITMLIFGAFWIFIRYILPMALGMDLSLGIREIVITAAYFITAVILAKIKIDEWNTEKSIGEIKKRNAEYFKNKLLEKATEEDAEMINRLFSDD